MHLKFAVYLTVLFLQHAGAVHWQRDDWAFGCDFRGNDIGNAATSGELCGPTCEQRGDCTHFTWTNYNGGTCWMKGGRVLKSDAFDSGDGGMVCGVIGGRISISGNIDWQPDDWAMSCDFHGNDIGNAATSGEQCGPTCKQRGDCTHFVWTDYNGGTCWMKGGGVSKSDAFSKPGAVCGVISGDSGSQQSGRFVGGSTGPQCLPGVDGSHSSCYSNGAAFRRTVPVPVDEVLAVHNKWRHSVNPPARDMPNLQWDDQLAIEAERHAARCYFEHDSGDARALPQWPSVGQNLFWGNGKDYSWTEAIDGWGNESNDPGWSYGQGYSSGVGHYTQVIWADTTHVGCGKADCGGEGQFLTCNYAPAGNYHGQQPYQPA